MSLCPSTQHAWCVSGFLPELLVPAPRVLRGRTSEDTWTEKATWTSAGCSVMVLLQPHLQLFRFCLRWHLARRAALGCWKTVWGQARPPSCTLLFPKAPTWTLLAPCPSTLFLFFLTVPNWSSFQLSFLKTSCSWGRGFQRWINPCILVPGENPRPGDPLSTPSKASNVPWSWPHPQRASARPQGLPGITAHKNAVCPLTDH